MEPRGAALYGPYYVYADVNFDVDTTTTVTISAGDYTVPRNENFTVNITVNQTVPITGVQLDLSFNPSLVSVNNVTNGTLLTQDGAEAYFINGTIDNTTGTLTGVAGTIIQSCCYRVGSLNHMIVGNYYAILINNPSRASTFLSRWLIEKPHCYHLGRDGYHRWLNQRHDIGNTG